jgi:hypothetical protein
MKRFVGRIAVVSGLLVMSGVQAMLPQAAFGQSVEVAQASGPDTVGAAALIQTKARVIGVDAASYSATLKGAGGRVFEVTVSPEVGDIGKLKVGDHVDIAYRESLLIHADKVKSNGIRERVESDDILPASGGVAASSHTVQVLATIEKVDLKRRLVTFRGPLRSGTVHAGPGVSLDGLKVGDSVRAEFMTATAVKVTRDDTPLK